MFKLPDNARRRRKPRFVSELAGHRGAAALKYSIAAMQPRFARDTVAALLAADDFDRAKLAALATRDQFPDASAALLRVVRPRWANIIGTGLLATLYVPPVNLTSRVALHLAVVERPKRDIVRLRLVTVEDIRRVAESKNPQRASNARTALAILGAPVAPFAQLSRRERAGFLLGLLVAAWRERAP